MALSEHAAEESMTRVTDLGPTVAFGVQHEPERSRSAIVSGFARNTVATSTMLEHESRARRGLRERHESQLLITSRLGGFRANRRCWIAEAFRGITHDVPALEPEHAGRCSSQELFGCLTQDARRTRSSRVNNVTTRRPTQVQIVLGVLT